MSVHVTHFKVKISTVRTVLRCEFNDGDSVAVLILTIQAYLRDADVICVSIYIISTEYPVSFI